MSKNSFQLVLLNLISILFFFTNAGQAKKNINLGSEPIVVTFSEVPYKLKLFDKGHKVILRSHAEVFILKSSSKLYDPMLRLLERSKKKKARVQIKVDTNNMEIMEVLAPLK